MRRTGASIAAGIVVVTVSGDPSIDTPAACSDTCAFTASAVASAFH